MRRAACAAAAMGLPLDAQQQTIRLLPDEALFRRDPETYWLKVREDQFYLPGWRSFLNNGSLGVAPRPVLAAVFDYLTRSAALMLEEYPRWGYEPLDEPLTWLARLCRECGFGERLVVLRPGETCQVHGRPLESPATPDHP